MNSFAYMQGIKKKNDFMSEHVKDRMDEFDYNNPARSTLQVLAHCVHPPTLVSAMMPGLIREVHFFEGDVPYGIKPEWAIEIHRIVEKEGVEIRLF